MPKNNREQDQRNEQSKGDQCNGYANSCSTGIVPDAQAKPEVGDERGSPQRDGGRGRSFQTRKSQQRSDKNRPRPNEAPHAKVVQFPPTIGRRGRIYHGFAADFRRWNMACATPRREPATTGHVAGRYLPRNHPPMVQATTIPMISAPSENHLMPRVDRDLGIGSTRRAERFTGSDRSPSGDSDAGFGLSGRADGSSVPATGRVLRPPDPIGFPSAFRTCRGTRRLPG